MAKLQLLGLPTEILRGICSTLCRHCQCETRRPPFSVRAKLQPLVALSLTCKLMRDIAQPVLHHCMSGNSLDLLRTVVARPDLAAAVRILSLSEIMVVREDHLADPDIALVEAAAKQAGIELPEDWHGPYAMRDLLDGRLADIVLADLPNLEGLEYDTFVDWEFGRVLAKRGAFLDKLKRLKVSYWDTEGGFHLADAASLLNAAPRLECLEVYMCVAIPSGLRLDNLRSVKISGSFLEASCIKNLVDACPRLESFSYNSGGGNVGQYADGEEATPGEIQRALLPRKGILEHIDFDFNALDNVYLETRYEPMTDTDELASFQEFTALKTLAVSVAYFPDTKRKGSTALVGMFPKSIEKLYFTRTEGPESYSCLAEFAKSVVSGELPNLKTVEFKQWGPEGETVREILVSAGIECSDWEGNDGNLLI